MYTFDTDVNNNISRFKRWYNDAIDNTKGWYAAAKNWVLDKWHNTPTYNETVLSVTGLNRGYLYQGTMLASFLYPIGIVIADIPNNTGNIAMGVFMSLIPINYALACKYFRTVHYDRTQRDTVNMDIVEKDFVHKWSTLLCLMSIGVSITVELTTGDIWTIPSSVTLWTVGRYTALYNYFTFILDFYKHKKIIVAYEDIVKTDLVTSEYTVISNVSHQLLKIRHNLNKSVGILQNLYAIPTLVGSIALGLTFDETLSDDYNINILLYIFVFLFTQTTMLAVISMLTRARLDILNLIHSPQLSEIFIKRTAIVLHPNTQVRKFINKVRERRPSQQPENKMVMSNATGIDWLILFNILKERWINFNILGMNFDNGQVIKKGVTTVAIIIGAARYIRQFG